jgi:hypothetical protein
MQGENKPLALIPDSQSDILDEETQRRPGAGGEGDCGSGNTSPCDIRLGESGIGRVLLSGSKYHHIALRRLSMIY